MIYRLCLLLFIGFAGVGYAQQYSSSPFSTQGLGEAGGLEDGQFGGIGNCRTAVMDSATVNLFNPSSYTALSKGQPLFAIGMSGRFSQYSTGDVNSLGRVVGLNQITMVLPLGKRFGMALGLQPFSRKGYNIVQTDAVTTNGATDSMRYTYLGYGSTQQVVGGLAYKLLDLKRHKLSIGANYTYVFGSVTNERRSELLANQPEGGVEQKTYRVHGANYSIGLNYDFMLDTLDNQHLRIGAVFSPQQSLSAHRDYFLFYGQDVTDPTAYDTLKYTLDDKGSISYPATMAFGFNYYFRPKADESYTHKTIWQTNIYGDFTTSLWSTYQTHFNVHEANPFVNSMRVSLGAQFTANYLSNSRTIGTSYFRRVRYRAGGYYGMLPNVENGKQLSEMGVTIGFGFPIASQRTNSSFNFSFQLGQRGSNQPDALREQFVGVNFGVILAPASYDKWFKKYKLD